MSVINCQMVVSCEHANNRVPPFLRKQFRGAQSILRSHRGYDPGAAAFAGILARHFQSPLYLGEVSRLVVELNRSLGHPRLWSEFTKPLPKAVKQAILDRYYFPRRKKIESYAVEKIKQGLFVLHLGVHSFTPVLDGKARNADVGILYDSKRFREKELARVWKRNLTGMENRKWKVRSNYPYHGASDGLTTFLRRRCGPSYLGLELELNQELAGRPSPERKRLFRDLLESLDGTLRETSLGLSVEMPMAHAKP